MRRAGLLAALLISACQSSPTAPPNPSGPQYEPIAGEALKELVVGNVAHFADNAAIATYFADGRYEYVGAGQQAVGTYTVGTDKVCVKLTTAQNRCSQFAMIGTDYWIIALDNQQRNKLTSIVAIGRTAPKQP